MGPFTVLRRLTEVCPEPISLLYSMAGLRQTMTIRRSYGLVLGGFLSIAALAQTGDEYRVKAAFLYNFSKFVEWPAQSFKNAADPLAICLVGKNPFGELVNDAVSGKDVDGRPFAVRELTDVQQARFCHILFISASESASERRRLPALLAGLRSTGTLTVGETPGFTEAGGVVNFKTEGGKVRIQINMVAAANQRLHISAKLLSLAEITRK
jgi:hypothetical protein